MTLTQALAGHDAVIHMAALIEVNESVSDPLLFAENNIVNSVRLAEAMRSAGVKKIVFSSSATVYGVPKRLPILEDDPTIAFNPYGATKLAMEACLSAYHFSFGFDVILLRYFNPVRSGRTPSAGEPRDSQLYPSCARRPANPTLLEWRAGAGLHLH